MLIPAGIVLLALGLRVATLGTWPVWIDEAFTLHDAFHDWPPYFLWYALTRLAVPLLGDGEAALRAIPCACGVATVGLLLRRRAPEQDPRLAALLLALSSWHLFWSQSARGYALQALLVLVAFFAWEGTWPRRRTPRAVTFALAMAGAVLCHPGGALFLPAFALLALVRGPRSDAAPVAGAGTTRVRLVVVLGIAAAGALVLAHYAAILAGHIGSKGPGSPWQVLSSYGFQSGPLLLLAAVVGAAPWRSRVPPEAVLAVVPVLALCVVSPVWFVTGYHAFATLPLVTLLAARGVARLRRPWAAVLVAALVVEQGAGLVLYHTAHGLRPRWREAAELAAAAASAGANVWSTQPPPLAFYTDDVPERAGKDYRLPAGVRLLARWTVDDLDRALARGEPTCVVIHVQDLQTWDAAQRDRLAHALDGRGLRSVRLPNRFGPKELTLALYASVDLRR